MYTLYVNVCGLMCKCIYGMDVMSLERSERSRPVRGILSFSAKVYGKHTINVFTCKKKTIQIYLNILADYDFDTFEMDKFYNIK